MIKEVKQLIEHVCVLVWGPGPYATNNWLKVRFCSKILQNFQNIEV